MTTHERRWVYEIQLLLYFDGIVSYCVSFAVVTVHFENMRIESYVTRTSLGGEF